MKKFLKNTIIIMLIICFLLNIINLVVQKIIKYNVTQEIIQIAEQVRNQGIKGEEGYQLIASVYYAGYWNKVEIQAGILVLSLILGIIIESIVYFCGIAKKRGK